MAIPPPLGHYNEQLATGLKRLAIAKFGRPKKVVEEEIFTRLRTEEPPPPRYGAIPGGGPFGQPAPSTSGAGPSSGTSFLDEWLAKRRAEMIKKAKSEATASGSAGREKGPAPTSTPSNDSDDDWMDDADSLDDQEDGRPPDGDTESLEPPRKDPPSSPVKKVPKDDTELLLRPKPDNSSARSAASDKDITIDIDEDGTLHQKDE